MPSDHIYTNSYESLCESSILRRVSMMYNRIFNHLRVDWVCSLEFPRGEWLAPNFHGDSRHSTAIVTARTHVNIPSTYIYIWITISRKTRLTSNLVHWLTLWVLVINKSALWLSLTYYCNCVHYHNHYMIIDYLLYDFDYIYRFIKIYICEYICRNPAICISLIYNYISLSIWHNMVNRKWYIYIIIT